MPTLWLLPKVWFQGSQSISTGGSSPRKGKVCTIICRLLQIMLWVLITALGNLVEPEVNRNLAMVSGVLASCARSTASVIGVAASSLQSVVLRVGDGASVATNSISLVATALTAAANFTPCAAKIMPGVSKLITWRSLA